MIGKVRGMQTEESKKTPALEGRAGVLIEFIMSENKK